VSQPDRPPSDESGRAGPIVAESRWPTVVALLAAIGLTLLMPDALRLGPRLLIPGIELILLVALLIGDPGKIDRTNRWLRWLSLSLVTVLIAASMWATAKLVDVLIEGTNPAVNDPYDLLSAGGIVWVLNNIAFAFLYWDLDSGGSAARAHFMPRYPDIAFPQQLSPEIAPPHWRPLFIDYFYLGFTNATAFSPTDAMPLAPWAKIAMTIQSVISLLILALVIARAVNVLA
jgi:hypothetical protein